MSGFDHEKTPSSESLISPVGETLQEISFLSSVSQDNSKHSPKASLPPEAFHQTGRRHRRIPLEIQFRDLLALFDKIVASAITVGARSHDPADHVIARALDDSLFELRMWLENIRSKIPDRGPSSGSLSILEKFEGPGATRLRNDLDDLETHLKELSATSTDTGLYGHLMSQDASFFILN